jgi:chromosome segregation ATPase
MSNTTQYENHLKDSLRNALKDSVKTLQESIESGNKHISILNARISYLKRNTATLKDSIGKLSSDTNYASMNQIYNTDESLEYMISGEQVNGIVVTAVEMNECNKMVAVLENKCNSMQVNLNKCSNLTNTLDKDLTECNLKSLNLERESAVKDRKLKEQVKKIWVNRGVAGLSVAILVLSIL